MNRTQNPQAAYFTQAVMELQSTMFFFFKVSTCWLVSNADVLCLIGPARRQLCRNQFEGTLWCSSLSSFTPRDVHVQPEVWTCLSMNRFIFPFTLFFILKTH